MNAFKLFPLFLALWAVNLLGAESLQSVTLRETAHSIDSKIGASKSALFLNISGWMNKGLVIKKRVNLNTDVDRSPDPSEFKSKEDTFAINYEFFMKDPEYKCRRPVYYRYFSNLLKTTPFENSTCKMNRQVTLVSESATSGNPMVARTIDPSRIYQIHYLFAGKGKQMMSRWGHAMFRLILCAPNKAVGPDCMNDYSQHVVVSYRANVEDMNIEYLKGMNGGYASQLFLMNMNEVVDEYTKGEFRDMISLPIKMSRDEINNFTDKLLENYWGYKGRYYFITNNCATEAMNLLRSAFPDNNKMQNANILTPLSLYNFLVKNGMTNPEVLNDKKNAVRAGYLFEGVSDKLQNSLNLFVKDKAVSFEDFALKLTPGERKDYYENKLNETSDNQAKILANALRLEEQILLSREQIFAKKMGNALFGSDPIPELKDTILDEKIIEMKDLYKKLSAESYLTKGYGVPLEDEFKPASSDTIKEVLAEIQGSMQELRDVAIKFFPKEVEDMKGTLENRQWVMGKML